jgi:hypothetical protein
MDPGLDQGVFFIRQQPNFPETEIWPLPDQVDEVSGKLHWFQLG